MWGPMSGAGKPREGGAGCEMNCWCRTTVDAHLRGSMAVVVTARQTHCAGAGVYKRGRAGRRFRREGGEG